MTIATTKHTAEPWTITTEGGELYICDQHDALLMRVGPVGSRDKEDHWNAERAVACVNACAGMEDPAEAIREARMQMADAIERAGFSLPGPTDHRAAEHGEPVWVCRMREALRALGG